MNRIGILIASLLLVGSAYAAQATTILSPLEALDQVKADKLVLIDIRRPSEWQQSGVAEPAVTLSMHREGFLAGLNKIIADNPGKQIGIICATGSRTAWLQGELAKRKLATVIDVSEGMFGNHRGPGWLARKLPTRKVK